jgi:hypothetical protein
MVNPSINLPNNPGIVIDHKPKPFVSNITVNSPLNRMELDF